MGKVDRAHGGTRLGLLIAAGVAVLAALAVTLVALNASGPHDSGPPIGIPTTRPPIGTPTSGESSTEPSESSAPEPSGTPTSVSTGAPSTREPTSRERYEEAARRELEQGLVAYNPPAQARVQSDFEVTVRVQRGTATVSPSLKSLPGTAPVIIENLPVGTYMRAQLRGSGFDIQPLSDTFQLIDGVTEWAWRVTPHSDGVRTLRLTLVVELNDLPLSSRTFERTIQVAVEKQPPWYDRATGLLDVTGVVTAIVIAAILGAAKLARMWWVRRNAAEGAVSEDEENGTAAEAPDAPAPTATAEGKSTATANGKPATTANGKPTASANGNKPNP